MGYGSWGPRVGHDWVTNTNLKHSFVTVKNENEIFFKNCVYLIIWLHWVSVPAQALP